MCGSWQATSLGLGPLPFYVGQVLKSTHRLPFSQHGQMCCHVCCDAGNAGLSGLVLAMQACRAPPSPAVLPALQIGMWERITAALAELRPEALTPGSTDGDALGEKDPEALVEYEGMLVSAAAAQRRRSEPRLSDGVGPSWSGSYARAAPVLLLSAVSGYCAALQGTAHARTRQCLGGGQAYAASALPSPVQTMGGLTEAIFVTIACQSWRSSGSSC